MVLMYRGFKALGAVGFAGAGWTMWNRRQLKNDPKLVVSYEELQKHNKVEDCWIAINENVYDVTQFIQNHPGGVAQIFRYAGKDATKGFLSMHPLQHIETHLGGFHVGEINDLPTKKKQKKSTATKKQKFAKFDFEEEEKLEPKYLAPPLSQIFSLSDFEAVAKKILSPITWAYISTGASDEFTLRENRYALGRIFFRPRCLLDVSNTTIDTDILGVHSEAPFYIGSFAGSHLVQPEAESVLTGAAGKEKIVHIIPKHGAVGLEKLLSDTVLPGQSVFYQHDFYTRKDIEDAPAYFKRIEATMPQVKAIFINVDIATVGNREKDYRSRRVHGGEIADELDNLVSDAVQYANPTWEDFKTFKASTNLPIIIKGLQRKEDVIKAAELGFRGALISNHGGRQLDFSTPTIETLVQVHKTLKEKKIDRTQFQVFVEGGFRRGSDVIKALCLGAIPGFGRGMLYSEVYGQDGVEKAIQLLKKEITRDMMLLGASSVDQLDDSFLDTASVGVKLGIPDVQYDRNYTQIVDLALCTKVARPAVLSQIGKVSYVLKHEIIFSDVRDADECNDHTGQTQKSSNDESPWFTKVLLDRSKSLGSDGGTCLTNSGRESVQSRTHWGSITLGRSESQNVTWTKVTEAVEDTVENDKQRHNLGDFLVRTSNDETNHKVSTETNAHGILSSNLVGEPSSHEQHWNWDDSQKQVPFGNLFEVLGVGQHRRDDGGGEDTIREGDEIVDEPTTARSNQSNPVEFESEPVWNVLPDSSFLVEHGGSHLESEVENGERPNTANTQHDSPCS
ncbi:hypothetical protein OGAPHI_006757 [Ogataea philodendri]|uniref:Cytochrome b2, mitochondrial n=1 Tax=Ogataea philodendri TaxID=1378263 RepID=A0A9P8NX30_9ASCO|nr:uncharacterized protein OGAPHI_006757 [Ogataea philodendri]KAH3661350.1 hypothetical protein OGAPHI_006757 [Ogataea philodendri]